MRTVGASTHTLADWLQEHPNVRVFLDLLLGIGIITFLHIYVGYLWTAGLCVAALIVWASGPWITHDAWLLRYEPGQFIAKYRDWRFKNADGTRKKPFHEAGPGEPLGDIRFLGGAFAGMLAVSKQAGLGRVDQAGGTVHQVSAGGQTQAVSPIKE